ncbi:competence protein F, putative [Pseudooceanicola batsensis HTCC2597]|uniref:Competence protein F, putative n=1 Tax=Pseudooceanicola batsensis (strain ATCC BAA-863 / DSM 15984 / KCTC 12145 / HTCC2597) TaxID=252305 RepID=A3TWM6_PSEBH|nr:ComF family protein [Pseudooceanicola batsensis]EAQ04022.1 competence protein F, putative [Pseudooceanicola batsensis HTCC2597]
MRLASVLQTALRLVYPPTCLTCDALVEADHGLCGTCWGATPFIGASVCGLCGAPLPGDHVAAGDLCDDCLTTERPWDAGRAALVYRDNARRLVLGLKHGDRMDIARPASLWMAGAAGDMLHPGMLVAPIPLHWRRRIRRRYNQSVLLGRGVAGRTGLPFCPDLLQRNRPTPVLDGKSPDERFRALHDAVTVNPRRAGRVAGGSVLLIDDVMTSGATLTAATGALKRAGAASVSVLTLARAVKGA